MSIKVETMLTSVGVSIHSSAPREAGAWIDNVPYSAISLRNKLTPGLIMSNSSLGACTRDSFRFTASSIATEDWRGGKATRRSKVGGGTGGDISRGYAKGGRVTCV